MQRTRVPLSPALTTLLGVPAEQLRLDSHYDPVDDTYAVPKELARRLEAIEAWAQLKATFMAAIAPPLIRVARALVPVAERMDRMFMAVRSRFLWLNR